MLHNLQLFELWPPLLRTSKQYLQSRSDVLLSWGPEVLAGERFHQLHSEHLKHRVNTDVYLPQPQFHRWEGLYLLLPPPHPPNKKREIRRLNLDKVEQLQRNSYDGIVFMSVLSTVQYISLIVHIAFTRAVRPMGIVLERSVISTQ